MISKETIRKFMQEHEEVEQKKKEDLKQMVLNHYNLYEFVYYQGKGDMSEYQYTDSIGNRFKYSYDISDDDFEKIYEIYKKENSKVRNNGGAETTLSILAVIFVIFGIISFAVAAANARGEYVALIGGLAIMLLSFINCAFFKVIVNISRKLNNLNK